MTRLLVALILASAPQIVSAQGAPREAGQPWLAFAGCWRDELSADSTLTCIVPSKAQPLVAEILSVQGGVDGAATVAKRTVVDASGARDAVSSGACTGWETANFSGDAARIYTQGELQCETGVSQARSGLMAITPSGALVHVTSVRVGEQERLQVARLRAVSTRWYPSEVAERLADMESAIDGHRIGAARALSVERIVDVSRQVPSAVTQAYMTEVTQGSDDFRLPLGQLEALASAGVANEVIDVAIALGNPEHFAAVAEPTSGGGANVQAPVGVGPMNYAQMMRMSTCSPLGLRWGRYAPFGFPIGSFADPFFGFGLNWFNDPCLFSSYAYSPFLGQWGFGSYGGFVPIGPIRIVPNTRPESGGRMTKGNGYTAGSGSTSGGYAQPRHAPGSSVTTPSGRVRSEGSGSMSGGSGGGSTGRTARPRDP